MSKKTINMKNKSTEIHDNFDEIDISELCGPEKTFDDKKPTTCQKIIAFWRPTDQYAYFGQWYKSDFELTADICQSMPNKIKELDLYKEKFDVLQKLAKERYYTTAEKFMMMGKAALFRDNKAFNRMAETESPKTHRILGKTVQNFVKDEWDQYCQDIVKIGNYLKFSQNEELMKHMKDTGKALLVEASPFDNIWGIGIRFDHPNVQFVEKWKGTNYLGECLMFVRSILI
jgi:ribA/ribD-fused uncharacterized protein